MEGLIIDLRICADLYQLFFINFNLISKPKFTIQNHLGVTGIGKIVGLPEIIPKTLTIC